MSESAELQDDPRRGVGQERSDPDPIPFRCNICGGTQIGETAERVDKVQVAFCADCTMGSIHPVPDDLSHFYLDDYYAVEDGQTDGYEDYAFTAEHGTAWAATMLEAFGRVSEGSILDIGCANGHLLTKLCPPLRGFGIEANPEAAQEARERHVEVLGADIFDPALAERDATFDIVTSIATFEHLADFRAGVERALSLMKPDGLLLFEVPLISTTQPNEVWYRSSLEHVSYPTVKALRRLFDDEIGVPMLGAEVFVQGFASLYVGVVVRDRDTLNALAPIWERIVAAEPSDRPCTPVEWRARALFQVIHAACTRPNDIEALAHLRPEALNEALLRRIAALWAERARNDAGLAEAKVWHEEQAARWEAQAREGARRVEALERDMTAARQEIRALERTYADLQRWSEERETERETFPHRSADALLRAWTRAGSLVNGAFAADQARMAAEKPDPFVGVRALGLDLGYQVQRLAWSLEHRGGQALRRLKGKPPRPLEHRRRLAQPVRPIAHVRHENGPLVSIVIPCFNYGRFVADAVASAKAQTFRDIEVIVVDGGSTDGTTPAIVRDLADEKVQVFLRKERHRLGGNRNYGIERARGRYVCCLDADDRLPATYIEKAVFLAEHFGFDVVGGSVQMFGLEQGIWQVPDKVDLSHLLEHGNGVATNALFRRDAWKRASGFRDFGDGSPSTYVYEDYEFWVRLAARGAGFHNMHAEPGLLYRIHGNESLSRREGVRNYRDHTRAIVEANPGVVSRRAQRRSRAARRRSLRVVNPLINLVPTGYAPEPRSLIVALPFMLLGGAERLLSGLLESMAEDGWSIAIVTTLEPHPSDGNTRHWFERATPDIFDLPRFLPDSSRWPDFLDYLIASRAASRVLIVGSAFVYDQLPRLAERWPGLKVFSLLFNTVGHTARHLKYARHIDVTLVENAEVRDWLVDRGETPNRIETIPSGVDLDRHRPQEHPPLRDEIGAGPDDIIVGFSGRWSIEKNPLGFIQVAMAFRDDTRFHFVMTGAGNMADEVHAAVEESGLPPERMHLLGAVTDLDEVLPGYDILVVPSTLDGRPVVILEALAFGVPVIASRVGGIPELVRSGSNGALCDPGDMESFVQAIRELAADPSGLVAAKAAARAFAELELDVRKMTAHYVTVLSVA